MSAMSATRKAAVWVGIVFLLGLAAGAIGGYAYARWSVSAGRVPLPEPERRAQRVAQLSKELALTTAQAQQLDVIIMQRHAESKAIHDQTDAQIEKLRQAARNEIRGILTPEQKPKFEELLRKMDEERKKNAPK